MKISCERIYELAEAVVASGFPKKISYSEDEFEKEVRDFPESYLDENCNVKRAVRLSSMKDGSGHKTFLSGILVAMNVTATIKWWVQFGRYHFQQIDSSMSTMHCLRSMGQSGSLTFNDKTDKRVIEQFYKLIEEGADDEAIAYSCPAGAELTARVNTNYLQLRTMFVQRRYHKLKEWRIFCEWIESLPYAKYFIIQEKNE